MTDLGERSITDLVAYTLDDAGDPHVVVGPLRNQRSDGASAWRWYFHISTCDENKAFRTDEITLLAGAGDDPNDLEVLEATPQEFIRALMGHSPRVVHDVGDELAAARLCEVLWPGERITALRKAVEAELRGRDNPPAQGGAG